MEDKPKLLLMIKELSVSLFTELSEEDKRILGQNLNDVLALDAESALKNFSILYESLDRFKSEFLQSSTKQKFKETEDYQKELQKLDSEIRSHFKCELEMKVLIDGLDEKMKDFHTENLTLMEQNYKVIEKLLKSNKKVKESIRQKTLEIEELKKISNPETEKELFENRVKKESEMIQEVTAINEKNYKKFTKMKNDLEITNKEYEKLRSEFLELKSLSDHKLDLSAFTIDLSQESFEIKSNRQARTPDRVEKSLSPILRSKKKHQIKINKISSRIEKSPFFYPSDKKKSKKKSRMTRTPKKKL